MGRLLCLAAALGAVGCGKVAPAATDAAIDAEKDAFTCPTPEVECGVGCTDLMTDGMNCGTCGTQCQGAEEMCIAGHCTDSALSCVSLKQVGKPSGIYTLDNASVVFCDMEDGGATYSSLSMDNWNGVNHVGYTMVSLADLQTPSTNAAFIALYNKQNGNIHVLDVPIDMVGNCAIKVSVTASMALYLNNSLVAPATPGGAGPELCEVAYTGVTELSFVLLTGTVFAPTTLPADYFTTNPPTEQAAGEGNNPAFFWKKTAP
jgi:hypothetical protein